MSVESSSTSGSPSERRRGSCKEKETFFLIFKGAGTRLTLKLLDGAEIVLLCVDVTSPEVEEQIDEVGDDAMDETVGDLGKTESIEERVLEATESWRLWRTAWTIVGSAEKEAYSMRDSAFS
jgi:hypothetical protein